MSNRLTRVLAIIGAAVMLAGASCTRNAVRPAVPDCPTTPVVVDTPAPYRLPVAPELTDPLAGAMCETEGPTVGQARVQRRQACDALALCNARLREIAGPGGDQ